MLNIALHSYLYNNCCDLGTPFYYIMLNIALHSHLYNTCCGFYAKRNAFMHLISISLYIQSGRNDRLIVMNSSFIYNSLIF